MSIQNICLLPLFGEANLLPQNATEALIMSRPEWQRGLYFGKPRKGHPEGLVLYHVQEVLYNIMLIDTQIDELTYYRLRLIALLHDNFKYCSSYPYNRQSGRNHHGRSARQFAEQFIDDQGILQIVEQHDDAYHIWRHACHTQDWQQAELQLKQLACQLGQYLQLYYLFFKCDTRTGDKNQQPLHWLESNWQIHIRFVSLKEDWSLS